MPSDQMHTLDTAVFDLSMVYATYERRTGCVHSTNATHRQWRQTSRRGSGAAAPADGGPQRLAWERPRLRAAAGTAATGPWGGGCQAGLGGGGTQRWLRRPPLARAPGVCPPRSQSCGRLLRGSRTGVHGLPARVSRLRVESTAAPPGARPRLLWGERADASCPPPWAVWWGRQLFNAGPGNV